MNFKRINKVLNCLIEKKNSETKTKKKKKYVNLITEEGKQWKQSIGKGRGEGNGKPTAVPGDNDR